MHPLNNLSCAYRSFFVKIFNVIVFKNSQTLFLFFNFKFEFFCNCIILNLALRYRELLYEELLWRILQRIVKNIMYMNLKIDCDISTLRIPRGCLTRVMEITFPLSSRKRLLGFPLPLIRSRLIMLGTINAIKYGNAPWKLLARKAGKFVCCVICRASNVMNRSPFINKAFRFHRCIKNQLVKEIVPYIIHVITKNMSNDIFHVSLLVLVCIFFMKLFFCEIIIILVRLKPHASLVKVLFIVF